METSDTSSSKRIHLEDLSKDELIKKCNNLLLIAKKAKQAKDESSEELKKYKENEIKLSSDVSALKEVVESFNKKQSEFAEVQNKHKISEEKNSELKKDFKKLEEKYAAKIAECSSLEQILKKLSAKISTLEISNSEYIEKLNDFKESYAKLDIENKVNLRKLNEYQQRECDIKRKLQMVEEKYIQLEITLKEFQGKYTEECRNHEELQDMLTKLQNKNSSGRCSSRSSDSLKPVYENQEYDEIVEKYNEVTEKNKIHELEIEKLNKKLYENELLIKEWEAKYDRLADKYKLVPENWNDLITENEKLHRDLHENEKLKQFLKEKETDYKKLIEELNEKNKSLINQEDIVKENEQLKNKVKSLEDFNNEQTECLNLNVIQHDKLLKDYEHCQFTLNSIKSELNQEKEGKLKLVEELDGIKNILYEKSELLYERSKENQVLKEKITILEQSSHKMELKLREMSEKYENYVAESQSSHENLEQVKKIQEAEIIKLSSDLKEKEQITQSMNEKYNDALVESERLLKQLEEKEHILVQLKKDYEATILEKDKLIEICQSDKSTEEVFKRNICQLKDELMSLREENDEADKRYKEMEQKLEESRVVSELLKKEIDGKCDEYDAFKKEMEFYKSRNDELKGEITGKEEQYNSCKKKCDQLIASEKENLNVIERLKNDLKSARESLKTTEERCQQMEKLRAEENNRKIQGSYFFDEIHFADSQNYKGLLDNYLNASKNVDSTRLMDDLTKIKSELERLKASPGKIDRGIQSDEGCVGEKPREEVDDQLQNKISTLSRAVGEIKSLKTQINKEVQGCLLSFHRDHFKIIQDIVRSINDVFYNLQNGNSELLKEMNDMNQVLKERGEVVSKLEQLNESQRKEILEAESKISQLDVKLLEKKNKLKQALKDIEETKVDIENKEKTIKEMEEEIWKLKNSDSHTEALSSSTLSRVEEAARLMDVEDSFEDRYSKLKVVAAKLKKRVTEQQKQLEEERSKSLAKSNEFQNKIANFQSQIKSFMNLQGDYDRLQDMFEEEKNDKNKLKKALELADEKMDSLRQEVDELKKEKDKFLNDKNSFENIKKKLSAQIITLKASVEEEKNKQVKLEKEIERIEYERISKEKKLDEEMERHKTTTALLEKQKMETKNLGVLKLEIAEYEKSVGDLEKKLSIKEEEVKELNCLIENQRSQCQLYLDEITHLKSQLTQENEKAIEANNQMKKFNEESSSREVEMQEKINEIGSLKVTIEEKKKEMEELSLELAKISQEKMKAEEKWKNTQDHCSREIHSLQDTVGNLQDSLNQRDLELSELKKEFDAYKIRAQSVLRQSQKDANQSKQRNVIEELEQVRSTSESLKTRLEESGLKMQKLIEENEVFQEEKNRLYTRIQELKNSLSDIRAENQELKQSKQKELENYNEALKLQKLQSETLAHCFQKKIEEMEAKHKSQVDQLTKENEQMQKQFQKIILSTNEKFERREHEHKRSSSGFVPVKTDKEILDVMLLEREECEGSESVDSVSPQTGNNANLIPLDKLLSSSDTLDEGEDKRSPVQDLTHLNEKLEKSENRIKHLTVLLSDAETDCARLQHLNDVLKEEIRRNQRNIEREQHAQNFEYMKNVVLKFISLHNVDERIRLVPVLNTILKLSPEEESILTNAARGIVEHSNRGWGSYLNIWPRAQ